MDSRERRRGGVGEESLSYAGNANQAKPVLTLFGKTFDKLTKETVKAFLTDSKKSKFKI